jgi:hypothetical protein
MGRFVPISAVAVVIFSTRVAGSHDAKPVAVQPATPAIVSAIAIVPKDPAVVSA